MSVDEKTKIVVGIDPSSNKHGMAIYQDRKLAYLKSVDLMSIFDTTNAMIKNNKFKNILFSIENVCANNFVYTRNQKKGKNEQGAVSRSIGKNQQSQIELVRMLDYLDVKYVLHKPQCGNWADRKDMFERVTGWTGQSNRDTRSAAFFGFIEVGINNYIR